MCDEREPEPMRKINQPDLSSAIIVGHPTDIERVEATCSNDQDVVHCIPEIGTRDGRLKEENQQR